MTRSVRCQFFLTPDETVDVVEDLASSSGLSVFMQLCRPGVVLEPQADLRDVLTRSEVPPRLLLTRRRLPPGSDSGTFDGSGVLGLVLVSLPFAEGNRLYLGEAGAKFIDDRDRDATAAWALVRQLKRRAGHKLLVRNVESGAVGPAQGVGCSEEAWQLAKNKGLELRQYTVENIEYLRAG